MVSGSIGPYDKGDRVPEDYARENWNLVEKCAVALTENGSPINGTGHFTGGTGDERREVVDRFVEQAADVGGRDGAGVEQAAAGDAGPPEDAVGFVLASGTILDEEAHANATEEQMSGRTGPFYHEGEKVPDKLVNDEWDELSDRLIPVDRNGDPLDGYEDRARNVELFQYKTRHT